MCFLCKPSIWSSMLGTHSGKIKLTLNICPFPYILCACAYTQTHLNIQNRLIEVSEVWHNQYLQVKGKMIFGSWKLHKRCFTEWNNHWINILTFSWENMS